MKISVVIPLFNKETYICRTIESALCQTIPPDEILVIDDGSMDGSASEVRKFSDPRVRLIQQPNAGECAARNRGIADARNELIAFLDADDEWKPNFLMHIQRLYTNFPDCGAYATAYEEVLSTGDIYRPTLGSIPPAPWIGIIPNLFVSLQVSNPFFPSSIVIPRSVCNDLGGFPVGIKRGGDLMMWIRLGVKYPIAYSPSSQVIYHTEALNRACEIFPSDGEPAPARLIETLLNDNEIPYALAQDVRDYYAVLQIRKAKELIKNGKRQIARKLLKKTENISKYSQDRLWWYFWALMPFKVIRFAFQVKSNLMILSHE